MNEQEARELRDKLNDVFDEIYCSSSGPPYVRARVDLDTGEATLVLDYDGRISIVLAQLGEISGSSWED